MAESLRHLVSILGMPAVSVPCGFTRDGLPVGLQIIARHHQDMDALRLAYAFQQATHWWQHHPTLLDVGGAQATTDAG